MLCHPIISTSQNWCNNPENRYRLEKAVVHLPFARPFGRSRDTHNLTEHIQLLAAVEKAEKRGNGTSASRH